MVYSTLADAVIAPVLLPYCSHSECPIHIKVADGKRFIDEDCYTTFREFVDQDLCGQLMVTLVWQPYTQTVSCSACNVNQYLLVGCVPFWGITQKDKIDRPA